MKSTHDLKYHDQFRRYDHVKGWALRSDGAPQVVFHATNAMGQPSLICMILVNQLNWKHN